LAARRGGGWIILAAAAYPRRGLSGAAHRAPHQGGTPARGYARRRCGEPLRGGVLLAPPALAADLCLARLILLRPLPRTGPGPAAVPCRRGLPARPDPAG